ncbi:hypothetical protein ASC66_02710 [Leifsonia sp. Root4]|uniref:siderophore-interacting protein n=1 Tax=Leifsonia sp. Root4 TaxID=1736525 RepID=UPI0006FA6E88|nr:siderophore-interacting protein [Leifsonia sp. Root4]KQW07892.1 hypothetical protein ASC66_02710 [Leifsonia sp. Root4]
MANSSTATAIKPSDPQVLRLAVLASARLSPSIQRVTVGGPALRHFTPMGYDQWFRLFLPRAGQEDFRLPTRTSALWYAQWLATPSAKRPDCRNYTVAGIRPELGEIDIDFVVHGDPASGSVDGIAAAWALSARPEMPIGLLDQGIMYAPPRGSDETLIVADESGLPAVEGILRSLPRTARGAAVIEVPHAGDRRALGQPDGIEVHWVVRAESAAPHALPGVAALAHIAGLPAPSAACYVFAVGESALATGVRRHAVSLGVPKANVRFSGYWKAGRRAGT